MTDFFPVSGLCIFCSLYQECPSHLLYSIYTYTSFKIHFRWHLFRTPLLCLSRGRHIHFYASLVLIQASDVTWLFNYLLSSRHLEPLKSKKLSHFHLSLAGTRPEGDWIEVHWCQNYKYTIVYNYLVYLHKLKEDSLASFTILCVFQTQQPFKHAL